MLYGRYNINTGIIDSTNTSQITNKDQLAALLAVGLSFIELDDGQHGGNAMVDLDTKTVVAIVPSPSIPNPTVQLIAALINNGTLDATAFHPVTVTQINSALTSANMPVIDVKG